tara:strand:- start:12502 stop:12921 length:420 start_codon:yes stop_codon:yes gene_type:complete
MAKILKLRVTKKQMEEICNRIAEGESLTKICKAASLPSYRTVLRFVQENDDAHTQYRRARALQCEVMRDQILDLVKMPLPGDPKLAMAEVQRRRLEADHMDKHIRQMQPLGVRDKAEDKVNDQVGQVTLSWANGSVEVN